MDDVVQIVGLYRQDLSGFDEESLKAHGEIWTINDWYRPYPWLKNPDRVYNIHPQESMNDVPQYRFVNWKQEYKEAISRGVKIITPSKYDDNLNTELMPLEKLEETFPIYMLQCSISIMMGIAILEMRNKIILRGVHLREDEYRYQVDGILRMAEYARERGIEIEMEHEEAWLKNRIVAVDWSKIIGLVPYWMRHYNVNDPIQIIVDKVKTTLKIVNGVVTNVSEEK